MTYKQVYQRHFGYTPDEYIACEVCTALAVDIHHILYKSQGGQDNIENLIALCRNCHDQAHFKKEPYFQREELEFMHLREMGVH